MVNSCLYLAYLRADWLIWAAGSRVSQFLLRKKQPNVPGFEMRGHSPFGVVGDVVVLALLTFEIFFQFAKIRAISLWNPACDKAL